jgi:hypothetical protein
VDVRRAAAKCNGTAGSTRNVTLFPFSESRQQPRPAGIVPELIARKDPRVSKEINAPEKRPAGLTTRTRAERNALESRIGTSRHQSLRIHDVAKRDSGAMQDEHPTNEPRPNRVSRIRKVQDLKN